MLERSYYMMSFNSTHDALCSEKALAPYIPVRIIPTLRLVSKCCGISLRIEEKDFSVLKPLLLEKIVEPTEYTLYHITPVSGETGLSIQQIAI